MNELQLSAKAVFKNYTPATYAPDALKAVCGPVDMDDPEPAITVMGLDED